MVADNQQTARDVISGATGIAGVAGDVRKVQSANKLTGLQGKQAVDKAQISATKAVQLGAQKPVITTPPQVVTFPK